MAKKAIDVRATTRAMPEVVWELLDDSASWPLWTPIERFDLITPPGSDGLGEVRAFRTGRVIVREEIVERIPGRRLSYILHRGLAVRDYRADIDLAELDEGTEIRWHTTFRGQFPGTGWAYRRALDGVTRRFVEGLVEHSEMRAGLADERAANGHGTQRRDAESPTDR